MEDFKIRPGGIMQMKVLRRDNNKRYEVQYIGHIPG